MGSWFSPFYEKSEARRQKSVAENTPRCGVAKRGILVMGLCARWGGSVVKGSSR